MKKAPIYYIPEDVKVIFVSDMFVEDCIGGAELTLQAIIDKCPEKTFKLHSHLVTSDLIEQKKNCHWILCNFTGMKRDVIIELAVSGVNFSIVECDFKYCMYRSSHLHKLQTQKKCDCHTQDQGRFIQGFFKRAQKVFFMSQGQLDEYKRLFPTMENWKQGKLIVQGSTFDSKTLDLLDELYKKRKDNNGLWAVLGGGTWIKNQQETEEYCRQRKLEYQIIGNVPYVDFLRELCGYKGLIFHPKGFDTSPRITIEAKVLGLKLDLNKNVLQQNEFWFKTSDRNITMKHLRSQASNFWKK